MARGNRCNRAPCDPRRRAIDQRARRLRTSSRKLAAAAGGICGSHVATRHRRLFERGPQATDLCAALRRRHGPDGRGNGPAAPSMIPRPRDFMLGFFKYKSTPPGEPPTDADLERVVADGLQASAMPYFKDLLSETEIRAVVGRIKEFSPVFQGPKPAALPVPPRPSASPAAIDRGHALYTAHGCLGCHGADGTKGQRCSRVSLKERTAAPSCRSPEPHHVREI